VLLRTAILCCVLGVCASLVSASFVAREKSAQEKQEPLTPEVWLKSERFGTQQGKLSAALSPDARYLAYVLQRPPAVAKFHHQPFLEGNDRADIWLANVRGGTPQNITRGAVDGSGYWSPLWSPDGQRLAMLSTKGGNVRLWVWEKNSGKIRLATLRGVDPLNLPAYAWVSAYELVCSVLAEGERPEAMTVETQTAETAMREWRKAWAGKATTASVLESGQAASSMEKPKGQLLLINVVSGRQRALESGRFCGLKISPDGSSLAFLKQTGVFRPDALRPLRPRPEICQPGVADIRRGVLISPLIEEVTDVSIDNLKWSPDGSELSFSGVTNALSDSRTNLYRFVLADQKVRRVTNDEFETDDFAWSGGHELLVRGRSRDAESKDESDASNHWWLVEASGRFRNLTTGMKTSPDKIFPAPDNSFVGAAGGDLWRFKTDGGPPQNLTTQFEPHVTSIWKPDSSPSKQEAEKSLIVESRRQGKSEPFVFDISSSSLTPIIKPSLEAELVDYAPASHTALFVSHTRNGSALWLTQVESKQSRPVVEINSFLKRIAEGRLRRIAYGGADGRELKGWLVLPVNYREGEKYPLITLLYGGLVYGDTPPRNAQLVASFQSVPQLMASHGYAVLLPSMPYKDVNKREPLAELTANVLPAVDKAIEIGVAHPERLGVIGFSYGGYNVYGLLTQTERFRAGVTTGAASDLRSLWGEFDARQRYGPFAHEVSSMKWQVEELQYGMGVPPWKDDERYIRNSPLSFADKVQTPLLIIQGDMDYVGMQQGEQFFTALYRQNKKARFVRYWGEGHLIASPANIRDMWRQIFAWFDEHLAVPLNSR
jgi:dipeptidyl aminopeptidase/acylaminoacyl peptidase